MEKVIQLLGDNVDAVSHLRVELTNRLSGLEEKMHRMESQQGNADSGAQQDVQRGAQTEDTTYIQTKKELADHRTAPHKLILLWPSVQPLLTVGHNVHDSQTEIKEGYVMEAEDRGLPRLYGRGEGIDEEDGTQPGGTSSPARSDGNSPEYSGSAPPDGLWGYGFSTHPYPSVEPNRSHPLGAGGLRHDGSLDMDVATINSLYESYLKHMHPLHPFLDEKRTRHMIDKFIARYSPQRQRSYFAVGGHESDRPLKRQRSNGHGGAGVDVNVNRIVHTERSPSNAIVYLVLALGKICAHTEPLPGIVLDRTSVPANQHVAHEVTGFANSSPISINIKPSPMSPKLTPTQSTPPSLDNGTRMDAPSRRSSLDDPASPHLGPKNMDVIPGLAYYAKAAEILGDQADGNDLVHAQMFLLAGLYKGQLARVKESMSWITMAGRVVQVLLDRYKLYNDDYWEAFGDVKRRLEIEQKTIKDKRQGMIVLAAWTCLQLESDILAELRLPPSGIQSIENMLLMPPTVNEDTEEKNYSELNNNGVMLYYSAQMFLRKRLNQVHRFIYGTECLDKSFEEVRKILTGHQEIIEFWRHSLPPLMSWNDQDAPPTEILPARLRAKYWGAKMVINRVFLDYALHIMPHVHENRPVEDVAVDGHNKSRDKADVHLFKALQGLGDDFIWAASRDCINAAIQSTVAFDGVPQRLVVTNIHGTAHAQFGNMLVLAAVFRSNTCSKLVPELRFRQLLQRTIGFLRKLAPISPTCQHDCAILERINKRLFSGDHPEIYRNEREPSSTNVSFSA
jgi:hypothetical protein